MITISLQQEYIGMLGQLKITNSFFTTILIGYVLLILLISLSTSDKNRTFISSSLYYIFKRLLMFLDQFTLNRQTTLTFLPIIATLFIFILISNLVELLPGFSGSIYDIVSGQHIPLLRSPTSDLTTTLALGIISVFATQYYSYKALGLSGFLKRFINLQSPIDIILGVFDLLSELIKVLSFSFRLFGNLFAGEVILLITAVFVPFLLPIPFMLLELFVGIIQAAIFALLTLTFIMIARENNNEFSISKEVEI